MARTQLAFRSLGGVGLLDAAPVYSPLDNFAKQLGNYRCLSYSPDGRFFAWASPDQVNVIDPTNGQPVASIPAANVYELGFSPLGTYIITWQRPSKDEEGNAVKNLKVWQTQNADAGVVGQFVQKSQTGWNLQYTSDESYCARVVTNEVQFYQSGNLAQVWNHLRVEGVTDFAISPGKNHSVAVFVPERKGQPASVKVFNVPSFAAPVSQKTFFKGDKVQLKWNSLGTSLIVLASVDVDKSNRSYYGESNMYILSASGGFDSRIQLDKEGPIHDVTWSPASKEFGVVYGYMPAKTTIFNERAIAVHNFNLGPRNTILFSPHGRFVLVAGFGNLAGQMDIYDLQKDYAKVCTIEASNASVCEWSPDGQHILTATTSPRLRVDNGLRIWHVTGKLMYNEEINELYHVEWRPQHPSEHPLPNQVPPTPEPHPSVTAYLATVKTPSKPAGAYRPPGARGTSTPLAFKREDEGGVAYTNNTISSNGLQSSPFASRPGGRRVVPGAEKVADAPLPPGAAPGGGVSLTPQDGDDSQLSKAALKNKKKREAKKAKEAAEKEGGVAPPDGPQKNGETPQQAKRKPQQANGDGASPANAQRNREASRQPKPNNGSAGAPGKPREQQQNAAAPAKSKLNAAAAPVAAPAAAAAPAEGDTGDSEVAKKLRALNKKLRAIEDLKMRQARGEQLELSQVSKIKTEESVKAEINKLEG